MRRAPLLVPFSREHHTTLKLVRHIRALAPGAPVPAALTQEYAGHLPDMARHFAEEEALLLPRLTRPGDAAGRALADRLLDEHGALRRLLAGAPDPETLARLADLLEAHIRFEERELFPALEAREPR